MTTPEDASAPPPDTKDWTWTLERPCPECGVDVTRIPPDEVADRIRAVTAPWPLVLSRADVRDRPDPVTWSPLEYACHVRDVCRLFERRLRMMLEQDDPVFENWDQDAAAVAERYAEQDPAEVAAALTAAAASWSTVYAAVEGEDWQRSGRRSNGSRFTVLSLGRYGVHDIAHHLHDVGVPVP